MPSVLAIALVLLCLAAAPAAQAEPWSLPRAGIGLGLDLPAETVANLDLARNAAGFLIGVPLIVGRMRVEPEVGLGFGRAESELRWVSIAGSEPGWAPGDGPGKVVRLTGGVTVGPSIRFNPRMRGWLGPRAGLTMRWADTGDDRFDRRDLEWLLGFAAGLETFFFERVSLGGETRLTFASIESAVVEEGRPRAGAEPGGMRPVVFRRGITAGLDVLAAVRFYFR